MAQCITPFQLKERNIITGEIITVPCGKCANCVATYASGWSFRLMQEERVSDSAMFITLTYNEDSLLERLSGAGLMTLVPEDLKNFWKRLRFNHSKNSGTRIKYYCVGEYGSKFKRPHYHAIVFNATYQEIEDSWKLGATHYGTVTEASVGYTLKYMLKKATPVGIMEGDDRIPEFARMSKGLGLSYMSPSQVMWHLYDTDNRMYVNVEGGKKVKMPRYYKDKLFTDRYFEDQEQADIYRKRAAYWGKVRMENMLIKAKMEDKDYEHNKLQADIESQRKMAIKAKKGDKL